MLAQSSPWPNKGILLQGAHVCTNGVFKYLNALNTAVRTYGVLIRTPYVCNVVLQGIAEVTWLAFRFASVLECDSRVNIIQEFMLCVNPGGLQQRCAWSSAMHACAAQGCTDEPGHIHLTL